MGKTPDWTILIKRVVIGLIGATVATVLNASEPDNLLDEFKDKVTMPPVIGTNITVQEDGITEGTGINTLNFTTNMDLSVSGRIATISATGAGGTAAAIGHFESVAARDTYFTANLSQLSTGLPVLVNVGSNSISWYIWTGGNAPTTYQPNSWVLASGVFPSGSVSFGGREQVGAAGLGFLSIEDRPTGSFYHTVSVEWDNTGSRVPKVPILAASTTIASEVGTDVSPSQTTFRFSLDSTALGVTDIVNIRDASVTFVTAPTKMRNRIWEGTDTTAVPLSDIIFTVPGPGKHFFGPSGPDRQFFKPNTTYTIESVGFDADNNPMAFTLLGQDVAGTFIPAQEVRGSFVELRSLATENYVDSRTLTEVVNSGVTTGAWQQVVIPGRILVIQQAAASLNIGAGATLANDDTFAVVNAGTAAKSVTIGDTGLTFGSPGNGSSFSIPAGNSVVFNVQNSVAYPVSNYNVAPGGGGGTGGHPIVVRRDTPSLTSLASVASESDGGNSGFWLVAAAQITGNEASVDPSVMIRALSAGILDADGNEISTTAVMKSGVRLAAGTMVRVFSSTDLRVIAAPGAGAAPTPDRYPDVSFTGAIDILTEGVYNSFLERTATNAGLTTNQYIRMPSLGLPRPSWVNVGDVFVMRHTGAPGADPIAFRAANVGEFIATHGTIAFIDPGETIAIQVPATGLTWQLFPVSQGTQGGSNPDPEGVDDWYTDDTDAVATDNSVRLHYTQEQGTSSVFRHVKSSSEVTLNPPVLFFEKRTLEDDIGWVEFWRTYDSEVPAIGASMAQIIADTPTAVTYITDNINAGYDFQFTAPETLRFASGITHVSGNTVAVALTAALPETLQLGGEITIRNATNAVHNGTFTITQIGPGNLIHVTNTAVSDATADETTTSAFIDVPIYGRVLTIDHNTRRVSLVLYWNSGRTSALSGADVDDRWFSPNVPSQLDPDIARYLLNVGYNTSISTTESQLSVRDETGEFHVIRGSGRGAVTHFTNTAAAGNFAASRELPLNFESIVIETDASGIFIFPIEASDLPVGETRRFTVYAHPNNGEAHTNIHFGHPGSPQLFDDGTTAYSLSPGEHVVFKLRHAADGVSGVKIISAATKSVSSLNTYVTAIEALDSNVNPLPISDALKSTDLDQDPNGYLFTLGGGGNEVVLNGEINYQLEVSLDLRFAGAEPASGVRFVPVTLMPVINGVDMPQHATRQAVMFTRNGGTGRPRWTVATRFEHLAAAGDTVQFQLRFGVFPVSYSQSDIEVQNYNFTFTARVGQQ